MENLETILLREKLVESKNKFDSIIVEHRNLCKDALKIISNESNLERREQLLNYLFADNIDEVIENHIRKNISNLDVFK
jgi:hypothetical protein